MIYTVDQMVKEHVQQARAEVLAACLGELKQAYQEARELGFDNDSLVLSNAEDKLKALQPAAKDLEEYVKNLPLSEIARIKGIPSVAKLGKTYDRPDFTCVEDE